MVQDDPAIKTMVGHDFQGIVDSDGLQPNHDNLQPNSDGLPLIGMISEVQIVLGGMSFMSHLLLKTTQPCPIITALFVF